MQIDGQSAQEFLLRVLFYGLATRLSEEGARQLRKELELGLKAKK